jgi:acyl-CoA synthetase (AMP-forming)/AMP-acid ligase II
MRMIGHQWRSLVDVLRARADAQPGGRACTFLESGEDEGRSLTWDGLATRSLALGAAVAARVARGDRVLVMLPPSGDFAPAFLGVLCAGAVAVPTYPPSGGRSDRTLARLKGMLADAGISLVVAPAAVRERASALAGAVPVLGTMDWLAPEDVPDGEASHWRDPNCRREDLALLQYTSGSTSSPRGVMVAHGNLLENLAHGARLAGHDRDSVAVSWLPVNHDMGLIDGILQPVFSGFPVYTMAPAAFLQRPARWLQAISRYRATHSGGPNFAYDLCVRRVGDDDRGALDLGSWRIAFNGSEPVRHATLAAFQRAFGACGFRWDAFRPAYGLAEATLLVTSSGHDRELAPLPVSSGGLAHGDVRVGGDDAVPLVPSGSLDGTSRILVVDPVTRRAVDAGRIGEIWIAGPSVGLGYWRRPAETEATFGARLAGSGDGPFLRTGDLGFLRDDLLYVTGRLKDIIIVRGLKHYPQDLELTAEAAHPALRPGGCAAFHLPSGPADDPVALVAELSPRHEMAAAPLQPGGAIVTAIRRAVAETHQVTLAAVALVAAGHLPKTTSGKVQRYLCRDGYASGAIEVVDEWTAAPDVRQRAAS